MECCISLSGPYKCDLRLQDRGQSCIATCKKISTQSNFGLEPFDIVKEKSEQTFSPPTTKRLLHKVDGHKQEILSEEKDDKKNIKTEERKNEKHTGNKVLQR